MKSYIVLFKYHPHSEWQVRNVTHEELFETSVKLQEPKLMKFHSENEAFLYASKQVYQNLIYDFRVVNLC